MLIKQNHVKVVQPADINQNFHHWFWLYETTKRLLMYLKWREILIPHHAGWPDSSSATALVKKLFQEKKLSGDDNAAEELFKSEFQKFISYQNCYPNQAFIADETGLYWNCLTTGIQVINGLLYCTGSLKAKLVVIGKAKRPRSFLKTRTHPLYPICQ